MKDLTQLRQQLTSIPELYAQLPNPRVRLTVAPDPDARLPRRKGSPALANLDVLDLARQRQDGWLEWEPGDDLADGPRHGIHGTLELWIMLIESELADVGRTYSACECATISEMCSWLNHHSEWVVEHHDDFERSIRSLHKALERACNVRRPLTLSCPRCGSSAFVDGRFLVCRTESSHEVGVADLEINWRRRPPKTTAEITKEFPITAKDLHNASRGIRPKIQAVIGQDGVKRWLPWDVVRFLNKDLAEALDRRDQALAGHAE